MMFIKLDNIHKYYGSGSNITKALNGMSLKVNKGEMLAIMGKSGSGKSTLLNILGGIDTIDKGSYFFEDKTIDYKSQSKLAKFRLNKIGFIVQNFALIDYKNVYDNVALPLKYNKKLSKNELHKKVIDLLKKLKISDKAENFPYELSGGESQRVAIARAIINEPLLLLADEPTGALDSKIESEIMNIFIELNKNLGKTIVLVTHDIKIAQMCDRIINILDGKVIG